MADQKSPQHEMDQEEARQREAREILDRLTRRSTAMRHAQALRVFGKVAAWVIGLIGALMMLDRYSYVAYRIGPGALGFLSSGALMIVAGVGVYFVCAVLADISEGVNDKADK